MAHPVTWFDIRGPNYEALQKFYGDVFDWKQDVSPDGKMTMVRAEQPGGIAGGIGPSPDGRNSVTVYINVDDIDGHMARIQNAGGSPGMPKMELPNNMGFISAFTDPAGNFVGLWQPGEQPEQPAQPQEAAPARRASARKAPAKKKATAPKKAPAKKKAPVKKKAPAKKKGR